MGLKKDEFSKLLSTVHKNYSGVDLSYLDPLTNERYVPYCIEPALGLDRVILAHYYYNIHPRFQLNYLLHQKTTFLIYLMP